MPSMTPLRREYFELLKNQGVIEDEKAAIDSINTMSAADLRQAISASSDLPLSMKPMKPFQSLIAQPLLASSLMDISNFMDQLANELERNPDERTLRAQAYRNGQVQAYRDCATSVRMMRMEINPQAIIDRLRSDHLDNPMNRPSNRSANEIAEWLEAYFQR